MYKLLLFVLMISVWLSLHLLQVEEELAMHTLYQGKYAVNRAAHAASQQLDPVSLADGVLQIDSSAAAQEANRYLQANLRLDGNGVPLPGTFLKQPVEVVAFEVINADRSFPFTYRNVEYQYEVTLQRPGVVMIAKLTYPRTFGVLDPIVWQIKGAAELTAG